MKKVITMVDPPSGWKYGFPKPMPKQFQTFVEFRDWLLSEGYPESEIDLCGNHFYCRYFNKEVEDL